MINGLSASKLCGVICKQYDCISKISNSDYTIPILNRITQFSFKL